jgi:hypothetical protein
LVVVHNLQESPQPIREIEVVIPRPGVSQLSDLTDLWLDPNCSLHGRSTGGFEIDDAINRIVNYDGLQGIVVCHPPTYTITARGDQCSGINVRFDQPLLPGSSYLFCFSVTIPDVATRPFNARNRIHCLFDVFRTRGDIARTIEELDLQNREIPVWSNYPSDSAAGGFDIIVYAPPGSEPEPDDRTGVLFTESDIAADGGYSDTRRVAIWRLRTHNRGRVRYCEWDGVVFGCKIEPPVLAEEVRRQSVKANAAILLGLISLLISLWPSIKSLFGH